MSYYLAKQVNYTFSEALERTTEALKNIGFGIVTTIDMQAKLKGALDKDIKPYLVLGACNPHYANRVMEVEPHIGLLLPCNAVLRETSDGSVEVSLINAYETMGFIKNQCCPVKIQID